MISGNPLLRACLAALFCIGAAAQGFANTIGFDDLNGDGNHTIQNGYAGFNWSNVWVYDATNDPAHLSPSGYDHSVISPDNVAFNGYGNSATVSSGSTFDLDSAYLTAVWRDGLQVEVIGSLLGATLYDHVYTLSATSATLINFNYFGIDNVEFSIFSGGTHHDGYNAFDGTHFAIDNLTVNAKQHVPESNPWGVAGLSMFALIFVRHKMPGA